MVLVVSSPFGYIWPYNYMQGGPINIGVIETLIYMINDKDYKSFSYLKN